MVPAMLMHFASFQLSWPKMKAGRRKQSATSGHVNLTFHTTIQLRQSWTYGVRCGQGRKIRQIQFPILFMPARKHSPTFIMLCTPGHSANYKLWMWMVNFLLEASEDIHEDIHVTGEVAGHGTDARALRQVCWSWQWQGHHSISQEVPRVNAAYQCAWRQVTTVTLCQCRQLCPITCWLCTFFVCTALIAGCSSSNFC